MLLTLWIDGEISAKQASSRSTRADAERVAASVLEEMDRDAELLPEERETRQREQEVQQAARAAEFKQSEQWIVEKEAHLKAKLINPTTFIPD